MFVVLRDILELFVAQLAVECPERGGYFGL